MPGTSGQTTGAKGTGNDRRGGRQKLDTSKKGILKSWTPKMGKNIMRYGCVPKRGRERLPLKSFLKLVNDNFLRRGVDPAAPPGWASFGTWNSQSNRQPSQQPHAPIGFPSTTSCQMEKRNPFYMEEWGGQG